MKLFTKSEKAGHGKGAGAASGDNKQLFLHIAEGGWASRLVDPFAEEPPEDRFEDGLKYLEDIKAELHTGPVFDAMFRLAGQGFKPRDVQNVGTVHVLLDDPRIIFSDTRQDVFASAASAMLHDYGRQQLHCRHVTFGVAPFGTTGASGRDVKPNGVIGFMDAMRLGGYLTRVDRLATKVVSVTPLADLLVRRAMGFPGSYGGLYVGALNSHMVFANAKLGAVVYRYLPFGTIALARLWATGNGLSTEEAVTFLADHDKLAEIQEKASAVGLESRNASERILGDAVRGMLVEVQRTLEYFADQRCCPRPGELEVFGTVDRVSGLTGILRRLPVPIAAAETSPLMLFSSLAPAERMNLLSEAGSEIKIGSGMYSYHNKQLRPAEMVRREVAAVEATRARGTDRRGRGGGGRSARQAPAASLSLTDQIMALLGKGPAKQQAGEDSGGYLEKPAVALSDRNGFAGLGALILVVGFLVHSQYTDLDLLVRTQVDSIASDLMQNGTHHAESQKSGALIVTNQDQDKVLWTEKVLAIGRNMNNEMWLTDLFLRTDGKVEGKAGIGAKRLVMSGAVLPSTDGHIAQIGEFIRRLEGDTDSFMSDFQAVVFQGMQIDTTESDQVVRFTIEALYDEAKGRQARLSKPVAQGGGGVGIDQLKRVNERRNTEAQQYVGGARR